MKQEKVKYVKLKMSDFPKVTIYDYDPKVTKKIKDIVKMVHGKKGSSK